MITAGTKWGYVLAAYGLTAMVLVGLIAWVIIDGRRFRRQLTDLEARGVRRRSAADGSA